MKELTRSNEDLLLIRWLYTQRPDLVEQAQTATNRKKNELKRYSFLILQFLIGVIWANPKSFDGNSIVSNDSKSGAQLTAGVVSGATLFNAITNGPILFYSFRYIGLTSAYGISILLNIIILWWTNQSGTVAANQKNGNRAWSTVAVVAFLAMSTVQSIVAGVGAELLNNQEELSYIHADNLVSEKLKKLNDSYNDALNAELKEEEKCQTLRDKFEKMPESDPNRHTVYLDMKGGTHDQVTSGTLINPNAPCSPLHKEKAREARVRKEEFEEQRDRIDNDIEFLEQRDEENGSKTVKRHFEWDQETEKYHIRSGTTAMTLASENFWKTLTFDKEAHEGNPGASSSLMFFALSVITSLAAVILIVAHTSTQDTKMSRNSQVEEAIKHWLEAIRRQYALRPEEDKSPEDEKLLALFIDDYYQHGKCEYPVAQSVAKMSQKGVGLRLLRDGSRLLREIDKAYETVDKASFELNEQLSKANDHNALDTAVVKRSLAQLTQGVIRLLSLSDRYAASVSFEGDKTHYSIMKSLAEQLRKQLEDIKTTLYQNLVRYGIETATRDNALDDLRSYLVGMQGGCAELKELTQEAIRDKLIPIFGDEDTAFGDAS